MMIALPCWFACLLMPAAPTPPAVAAFEAQGVHWWPLQMTRECDDAILHLRTNEIEIGTWLLKPVVM